MHTLTFIATLALGAPGQTNMEALAERLSTLRGEVEQLAGEVDRARERERSEIARLADKRTDIELQLQREKLRRAQLAEHKKSKLAKVGSGDAIDDSLQPVVVEAIARVKAQIETSLPFRKTERMQEINKLARRVDHKEITARDAAQKLWLLIEDELKLTQENALFRQTVEVEGQAYLADIARLGMVAMYFKTGEGKYGRLIRNEGGDSYVFYTDQKTINQTKSLFEALEKQIRTGFFEIPNAFAAEVK